MPKRDIIVIGASAGGFHGLLKIISSLPADFPAAIFVVLHVAPNHESQLPDILKRESQLKVVHPKDGETFQPGHVYVAPPDLHMMLQSDKIVLSHGPKENLSRPAINPLFRSAARAYGSRVIGVILSGALQDGAMGMMILKTYEGIGIVQDPQEAKFDSMPLKALEYSEVDYILPMDQIAATLVELVGQAEKPEFQKAVTTKPDNHFEDSEHALQVIKNDFIELEEGRKNGQPTIYTCPDCGGTLWQSKQDNLIQFRCHVGHVWAPDVMLIQKSERLEEALWSCIRLSKENATLKKQLSLRAELNGNMELSGRLHREAEEDEKNIQFIRESILHIPPSTQPAPTPDEHAALDAS